MRGPLPIVFLLSVMYAGGAAAITQSEAVDAAKNSLRERIGDVPIAVIRTRPAQWRDASLGCPQPGMMYAQVITNGFRVVLKARGETYDWRVNDNTVRLCVPRQTDTGKDPADKR